MPKKEFLSSREFCELLGISYNTFKAMLKRGIPHYITGPQGSYRIPRRSALRWLKQDQKSRQQG